MTVLNKSFNNAQLRQETVSGFYQAARTGDCTKAKKLLDEYGHALINADDGYMETALLDASFHNQKDMIKLLLENGANINATDEAGATPLMCAVLCWHEESIALLLKKGANINVKNSAADTALHWAAKDGHKEIIELLLENGADIEAKDNDGKTPLMVAEDENNNKAIAVLKAWPLEKQVRDAAGPLKRDIPAPKVIRFPQPGE